MIRGKKGDVTVTILVIGVFLLGAFALLSFFVSDFKLTSSFSSIDVMNSLNSQIDEYLFYVNSGVEEAFVYGDLDVVERNNIHYLSLEKKTPKIFGESGGDLLFSVEYLLG